MSGKAPHKAEAKKRTRWNSHHPLGRKHESNVKHGRKRHIDILKKRNG